MGGLMAGTMRIEWNIPGFNALRKDPAVEAELLRRGRAIAERAGGEPDFAVKVASNPSRARVIVVTDTTVARELEATERSLTRALDAGRS
jgi:hypothetical protein